VRGNAAESGRILMMRRHAAEAACVLAIVGLPPKTGAISLTLASPIS
jgi:hypothetical protein